MYQQAGDVRHDLQEFAISHDCNFLDLLVVFRDEFQMRDKRFETLPARKRLRSDHQARWRLLRNAVCFDLLGEFCEVVFLKRSIYSDDQDSLIVQPLETKHGGFLLCMKADAAASRVVLAPA